MFQRNAQVMPSKGTLITTNSWAKHTMAGIPSPFLTMDGQIPERNEETHRSIMGMSSSCPVILHFARLQSVQGHTVTSFDCVHESFQKPAVRNS